MKKLILNCFVLFFSAYAVAQPTTAGGAYSEGQARQARENAEMNRHYESMKPSKKTSSNNNISGNYNAYGWGQGMSSERIAAGERNDALLNEWNDKVHKLVKLVQSRKIGKTSSDYSSFMEAARESFTGSNSDYTIRRMFPETASDYELYANDKSSTFYKKWFLEADKMNSATKPKPVYNSGPVTHNTQYGSGNLEHPLYFEKVTASQINEGYKQINTIDEYILTILADGKNNYDNSIDRGTRYTNSECGCDEVYGLKYYYKTFGAMEYGIFKGPGWDYPFLRMYLKTKTSEEVDETFNDFVNKFAAIEKFTRYRSEYTNDKTTAYFDIDNNEGYKYTVWIEKGYKSYGLRMGIDKKTAPVVIGKASYNFIDLLGSNNNLSSTQTNNSAYKSIQIEDNKPITKISQTATYDAKLSSSKNKNTKSYQNYLTKLNTYLKTFNEGAYGRLIIKGDELIIQLKDSDPYKAKIADLDKAYERGNQQVILKCLGGQNCMGIGTKTAETYGHTFIQSKHFNTNELIQLINDFLEAYKRQ